METSVEYLMRELNDDPDNWRDIPISILPSRIMEIMEGYAKQFESGSKKEIWKNNYRKALVELIDGIVLFESLMDAEMKKPASVGRGERIALLMNSLSSYRQVAMRELGYSWEKINDKEKI